MEKPQFTTEGSFIEATKKNLEIESDEQRLNNTEKEKAPISKVIIVDDRYAKDLTEVFQDNHTDDKNEFNVDAGVDLETALQKIRSLENTRGVAVLTDMYMPDKKGSFNPGEGLKVFGEIMEFYGMNPDTIQNKMEEVKQILAEYGDNIEKVSKGIGHEVSSEGNDIARRIREIFENDPILENFLNKILCKQGNMYAIFKGWQFPPSSLKKYGKDEKILLENNILEEKNGIFEFTDVFIDEHKKEFEDNIFTGKDMASSISYALLYGEEGGLPLGIRVAEEAHKKGLPVVLASGWHGVPGKANYIYADYLFQKGIINNPEVMEINSNDVNVQDNANKHSYFFAR